NDATPAGEKPAATEKADKWVARIEAELPKLMGSDKDAAYDKEKTAFMAVYANDPLRYQWALFDARRAIAGSADRAQGIALARGALANALYAADVPANVRELASTMNARLEVASPSSDPQLVTVISDYIKAYPASTQNASLANGAAVALTKTKP